MRTMKTKTSFPKERGLPSFSILTPGNPKILKGMKRTEFFGAVLMLSPANRSGYEVCSHASPGCRWACLNTSGKGGLGVSFRSGTPEQVNNAVQMRRIERTLLFFRHRDAFFKLLTRDISMMEEFAARYVFDRFDAANRPVFRLRSSNAPRMRVCVRLNGTSDLPWESIRAAGYANIMAAFPSVMFYDYTKIPGRRPLSNYHLTYSWSEMRECEAASRDYRRIGVNTAVVFDALPAKWKNLPVIDGLNHDFRFLDPKNVIVGLTPKGFAARDTTGFVVRTQGAALRNPPDYDGGDLFPDIP